MNVNNISFKSNLLEQMQKKSQSVAATVVSTPIADEKDSVELSSNLNKKKTSLKAIIASITAAIVLSLAIVKRKTIGKFFKKLFNKSKTQTNEINQETKKAKETAAETTVKSTEKIEFPKPQFTCGPEKPEQYAKEKKAYVDSIMPYLYKRDKQLKIKAIEAIEKYGSWEHGDKLGLFLGKRDEDIVVPVVRAIAATGGPRQALLINAFIRNPRTEYKSVNTYIEILDAMAKIGDMKKIDKSAHKIITAPLQRLKHHENPEIAKKANETLKIIFNK